MRSYTAADLEALARGQRVEAEVFQAIMADPEAVGELARLQQAWELVDRPLLEAPAPGAVPIMDVSWDELAAYGEGEQLAPERHGAVERFLRTHFPEALRDPASAETYMEFRSSEETEIQFRKGTSPEPPGPPPCGGEPHGS
jgi:hypothetical protein